MTRLYFAMLKQTEKLRIISELIEKEKHVFRLRGLIKFYYKNKMILTNMQKELGDQFYYADEVNHFN